MQKFSYKGLIKLGIIYTQIGGIFGLLFFTGMATFIFWGATQIQPISPYPGLMNDPRVTAVCFGIYFLLICWPFSCALINSAPTVWVTEDGILISAYLFFKIKIDWPDILFISEHKIGPFRTGHTIVLARRISFFHRLLGWFYARRFLPGFCIRKEIEDYELLLRILRCKTFLA